MERLSVVTMLVVAAIVVVGSGQSADVRAGTMQVSDPVHAFGEGIISRISEHKDADGGYHAPWTKVDVRNVFLTVVDTPPVAGDEVTVIPLGVDIALLTVKLTKVERENQPCGEPGPTEWSLEIERVENRAFYNAKAPADRSDEYPFDVFVLYAANLAARAVPASELTAEMLPKGIAVRTVTAAIDLTRSGQLDILSVQYCCESPSQPADKCDLTCGRSYRRVKGAWKLLKENMPC